MMLLVVMSVQEMVMVGHQKVMGVLELTAATKVLNIHVIETVMMELARLEIIPAASSPLLM